MSENIKTGTLEFDESEGKFVIANEESNEIIKSLEFGEWYLYVEMLLKKYYWERI